MCSSTSAQARWPFTRLKTPKQYLSAGVVYFRRTPSNPRHPLTAIARRQRVRRVLPEQREGIIKVHIHEFRLQSVVHRARHSNTLMDCCIRRHGTKLEIITGPPKCWLWSGATSTLGKGSCASLDRNGRSRDDAEGRDSEIRPSHEAPDRSASHQDLATTQVDSGCGWVKALLVGFAVSGPARSLRHSG